MSSYPMLSPMLAQEDLRPSATPATPQTQSQTGAQGGQSQVVPPKSGSDPMMWLLPALAIFMIFMVVLPQRREKKKRTELMSALKKGDRVQTIGGVLATVVEVRDQEVVLKVDEANNTRMHFTKGAIQTILADGKAAE